MPEKLSCPFANAMPLPYSFSNDGMVRLWQRLLACHLGRYVRGRAALIGEAVDGFFRLDGPPIAVDRHGWPDLLSRPERFDIVVILAQEGLAADPLADFARLAQRLAAGTRLVLEAVSRDHLLYLERRNLQYSVPRGLPLLSLEELIGFADANRLRILALIPYGAVLGGEWNGWLTGSWADGVFWRRLLAWCSTDESLLEWLVLLETTIVAQLPPFCTGRYLAVLEKAQAPQSHDVLQRWQKGFADLSLPIRLDSLASLLPNLANSWEMALDQLPSGARSHQAAFYLLSALDDLGLIDSLSDWLPDLPKLRMIREWLMAYRLDRTDYDFVTHWHRDVERAVAGVPLAAALEYFLMQRLVKHHR